MPHPIYGPAQHQLDEVTFKLWLPRLGSKEPWTAQVHGLSTTKRTTLWTVGERWELEDVQKGGYEPTDLIHHVALVCAQDRPTTQEQVDALLHGEQGWQLAMFPD